MELLFLISFMTLSLFLILAIAFIFCKFETIKSLMIFMISELNNFYAIVVMSFSLVNI